MGFPRGVLQRVLQGYINVGDRQWTDGIIMSPDTTYRGKISWFYFLHYRHLAFIIAQFPNDDNFVLGIKDSI